MTADKPLPLSEDALLRRLRLIATDDRRTYGLQGVSDDYDGLPLDDSDIARECAAAADLIERLAAELATARGMPTQPAGVPTQDAIDAERYRWLRQQHWDEAPIAAVCNPKVAVKLGHDCPSLERLDAAIDLARSKESP